MDKRMTVKSCTKAIINQKKKVKSFSLVLLLLFLIVLPSLQLIPKAKANPNWLSGWQYRKSHIINGSTAGEQTNYQVKIVAKYGSDTSTFGKTTVGGSYSGVSGDYKFACRFYLANDGTVTKITWYGRANPMGGSTANVRAGIYSDSNGAPDALLASSDEVTISTTAHWWEFTLSASLTAGYYWLAIITDSAVYRYHDTGATDQAAYNEDTYSDGFSDPFGSVAAYQNYEISIYATVIIDTDDTVYLNGQCRTDFGDVRFTDSDGTTPLDYWMEDYTSGDNATFWVELPSIPASPNTATIYVYYGKSDATTTSNGDNTFLEFHDFEGGTTEGLTVTAGSFEAYNYGGDYGYVLRQTDTSTGNRRGYWTTTLSDNICVEGSWKRPSTTSGDINIILRKTDGSGGYLFAFRGSAYNVIAIRKFSNWATPTVTNIASTSFTTDTSWHTIKITRLSDGSMNFTQDSTSVSATDTTYTPDWNLAVWCGPNYYLWDNLRVDNGMILVHGLLIWWHGNGLT